MRVEGKDWVSLSAVAVSVISAGTAIWASHEAQKFSKQAFRTERTLEILASAHEEMTQVRNDPRRLVRSCFFVRTLADAEDELRENKPPHFVRGYIEKVSKAGLWPPRCEQYFEDFISRATPAATEVAVVDEAQPEALDAPKQIGQWHALIASYNATPFGCKEAKTDVRDFSEHLAGKDYDGRFVYVVRTKISKNYAVTVDAGDNKSLAKEISGAIRDVDASDGTGTDSFVQGNRGWFIDPDCVAFARIGSG